MQSWSDCRIPVHPLFKLLPLKILDTGIFYTYLPIIIIIIIIIIIMHSCSYMQSSTKVIQTDNYNLAVRI